MAHVTEAACLLQSGALYAARVALQAEGEDPVFAGFKHGAFSLYFGDAPIAHFDLEGRWQRAYADGLHYLKALDTTVQTIDRVREGENLVLKRRTLDAAETAEIDRRIRGWAAGLIAGLDAGRFQLLAPPASARQLTEEELRDFLNAVVAWDALAWAEHARAYQETYTPVSFLPPDALQSVVLQATTGNAEGLGFGGASTEGLSARTPEEFEAHAELVASLMGRRVSQCRNVFLAGAEVLRRPEADVTAYLETISRVFDLDPSRGTRRRDPSPDAPHTLDGVQVFLDRFDGPRPPVEVLKGWQALGLTRSTIGLESGDPAVQAVYGRPQRAEDVRAYVADLKAAGLTLGVVVLVGAGGEEHASGHVAATADLVNSLDLGQGDVVYLVDASELSRAEWPWTRLDPAELKAQTEELRFLLTPVRVERKAKVAPYSLEKQGAV